MPGKQVPEPEHLYSQSQKGKANSQLDVARPAPAQERIAETDVRRNRGLQEADAAQLSPIIAGRSGINELTPILEESDAEVRPKRRPD